METIKNEKLKTCPTPLVSVVVLNFNGKKYLEKTLPSIFALHYSPIEIIVVDNGSTDGSVDYIKQFPIINLLTVGENTGYSKGKNIGLRATHGQYVLAVDEDIFINDTYLVEKLLKAYSDKTGFLQVPLVDEGENNTFYYGTYYSVYGLNMHRPMIPINHIMHTGAKEISGPTGGFFFIAKDHLSKIGYFDESQAFHLDDVDIGPRAWLLGFVNYLVTDSCCVHLGVRKTDDIDLFVHRFTFMFSGHARAMLKNFSTKNLIVRFPVMLAFHFFKAIRFSVKKQSAMVVVAFIHSFLYFLRKLPDTLRQRSLVQSRRVTSRDLFLEITPPKFRNHVQ